MNAAWNKRHSILLEVPNWPKRLLHRSRRRHTESGIVVPASASASSSPDWKLSESFISNSVDIRVRKDSSTKRSSRRIRPLSVGDAAFSRQSDDLLLHRGNSFVMSSLATPPLPRPRLNVKQDGTAAAIKVFLPSGEAKQIKAPDTIDIKGIIQLLMSRLSDDEKAYTHLYAMRLMNAEFREPIWLHQDMTLSQVKANYFDKMNSKDWVFELRIRYLPTDLSDLYDRDKITFSYYYDQNGRINIFSFCSVGYF
uniref:Focal adhesion kinase 1 n=1 Tax=Lepeophtheirus salmonis TaxID=72036 RepID=C1BUC9_LEPSM|nr:Focal adhesion kinase 1 [Lepeophtheirus salmonis]